MKAISTANQIGELYRELSVKAPNHAFAPFFTYDEQGKLKHTAVFDKYYEKDLFPDVPDNIKRSKANEVCVHDMLKALALYK